MPKKKRVGKKGKKSKNVLNDAARAIGSALGTLTVQADALAAKANMLADKASTLATKAKALHLPSSAEEATRMVRELLSPKKKAVARRKTASRKK